VRAIISRLLAEKGIEVHNDTDVCSRTAEGALVAQDGRSFQADEVFWCTQVRWGAFCCSVQLLAYVTDRETFPAF
jgi:NADH dehydrogenase FAD-containing subunit